ncbi:hypothetical protein [Anaerocolumna xylanovorans]|uniref:Uncharacterized protein n=1 Tax=Anaerocolumna xylanovorans DSM 12503 TaxID=1121345 RepID=A0A1M7Y4D8_9FIRM|nr:hypothetical protein [Anaerocolumna xylanovorans]SHO47112.1 hypothetical protein SAMN02745217_01416 [Anaerocolumna xylanovorans DSM 12503]
MKKTVLIKMIAWGYIVLIIAFGLYSRNVLSEENNQNDVEIVLEKSEYKGGRTHNIQLKVIFNNLKYYSENVLLSYHIYDDSNNVIKFENERIPINISDNTALVNYKLIVDRSIKKGIIKFDLVDEKNSYWFSANDQIKMSSSQIDFKYNILKSILAVLKNEVSDSPYIFSVNVIVGCLAIGAAIYINKKEIL